MTIKLAQQKVDQWIKQYGVRYFNELTNLALLMEETGELARLMAREFGEQSAKPHEVKQDMADELADVLFVIICLANQTGIDLEKAFKLNIEKKINRDKNRHSDNPKLHT